MIGSTDAPTYVVTKVGKRTIGRSSRASPRRLERVPIDRAVQATATARSAGGPTVNARGPFRASRCDRCSTAGARRTLGRNRLSHGSRRRRGRAGQEDHDPVEDCRRVEGRPGLSAGPTGRGQGVAAHQGRRPCCRGRASRQMLLFAPRALTGKQARAPQPERAHPQKGCRRASSRQLSPKSEGDVRSTVRADRSGICESTASTPSPRTFVGELGAPDPALPGSGTDSRHPGQPGG